MAFIQYLARIQFDFGARKLLPAEMALHAITRPLIVSDAGLAASGLLAKALEAAPPKLGDIVFTDVQPNPRLASVLHALDIYRESGCDGIIAIGGGSVIDCGKAVALLATHEGPLHRYRSAIGGADLITARVAPLIAVPTTAGTGSEVGRGMGIVLPEDEGEGVFHSLHLIPKTALCDPELTLGMPPALTAGTGADALSHCVEAYLSPAINPPADAIALDAARRIVAHLPRAVRDGADREARWNVMMGAVEAAMAMWNGLGAAHALATPMEAANCHHGALVGVLLPHAVRFGIASVPPERVASLAAALGADPRDIPDMLNEFNAAIGLPPNLRALGVPAELLAASAERAAHSIFAKTAPRAGTPAEYLTLATEAYG